METNNVNNTKKNPAGSKSNAYQICLVALAVGINIAGGQIALLLKLPVYLDSIGTILTGALLGPWFGMLPNLISGIFMGMTVDIYSLYFAPVGMITGIMSGLVFRKLSVKRVKVLAAAAMITVPGTVVSSVWRSYFFRIFNSGAASFTYTTWPDRKYFCSSVPDRLSRSLHRSFCSQCICDHAQWRNETETDRKCA